jgi:hypothetical protein
MTRPSRATEHELQTRVINWARNNATWAPCLEWLHAIPNGAQYGADRHLAIIQNNKLKAEGLTPGICDLFLPFPARGYHGLYLEMKSPGKLNDVRPGQRDFMTYAESVGYLCEVHDSSEAAIEALEWYLG